MSAATETSHETSHYVKIWAILLALLVVSVLGPMLGIRVLTMITAFGIAIVKAGMVAKHFMHLNVEKRYIHYLLLVMLAVCVLFFAGVAPDVMMPAGQRWEKHPMPQHSDQSAGHNAEMSTEN